MTEGERRALGNTRRLVFQNLANGVPADRIREDMRLSDTEIEQARVLVAKKIIENRVLRRQAPVPCETMSEIRYHRRELLGVLSTIGDLDLSTSLILSRVTVQAIDHPEMIQGAQRRMSEAYK